MSHPFHIVAACERWAQTWSVADVVGPTPARRTVHELLMSSATMALVALVQYSTLSERAGDATFTLANRYHLVNVGALGLAALFGALACRKPLTVGPTSVLAPLLAALSLCAGFSLLAPFWFPPGLVGRWLVSLGIVTLLAAPLSLRLWGMWLFAAAGVAREHRMKARARAAVAGVARDTLAGRIEAYGDDTVTLSIPSEGIVTMAKRLLPESMVGDAYVGSWLLFEMPQLTKMSDGTPRLDAIRCEYVGDSPAIATSWLAGEVVVGALALLASMAAAVGLARALTFIAYGS